MKNENAEGIKLKYLAPISQKRTSWSCADSLKIPVFRNSTGDKIVSYIKVIYFYANQITSPEVVKQRPLTHPAGMLQKEFQRRQGLGSTFRQMCPFLL